MAAVRGLLDALARGKCRYVANVLAGNLSANPARERVELFFQAIHSSEFSPAAWPLRCAVVLRLLGRWLRRDRSGSVRLVLHWLCLSPRSRLALRILLRLCRGVDVWNHLYCAAARALGHARLAPAEQLHLCRLLLQERLSEDAAMLARLLLERRPGDGEARHLLWSALMQMGQLDRTGGGPGWDGESY
ncbi:MAG: hypothetical protein LBP65_02400 [Puniceicoccales bacterium]|nr:hypothetical protein [Puniceicoccales bacterium]